MIAKLKETGELVEGKIVNNYIFEYIKDNVIFDIIIDRIEIIKDDIDWEQRKFELVKVAMQSLLSTCSPGLLDKNLLAALSIDYADTVLAEYRKEGNE